MMRDVIKQRMDNAKKGRIILVSLLVIFSLLGHQLFGLFGEIAESPIILSVLYAFLSILVFFWVLRFKLNFRIITVISLHLALIIFTQVLFLQTFFAGDFARVSEAFLVIVVLIIAFLIIYFAFLTANIFAVSSFRRIPLEAVAKTSIYLLTVLSVFFLTYSILSLQDNILFAVFILLIFYILFVFLLMTYFFLEIRVILTNVFLIIWNVLLILAGTILFGMEVEFIALITTVVFYYAVDFFIERCQEIIKSRLFEYFFFIFLVILFIFYYFY